MKHHTERRARTPREDARLGPEKAEARPSGHWTTEKGAGRKGGGADRGRGGKGRGGLWEERLERSRPRARAQKQRRRPAPSTRERRPRPLTLWKLNPGWLAEAVNGLLVAYFWCGAGLQ